MKQKKFECALGFHKYTIPDKYNSNIKICKHCKKFGYYEDSNGFEKWTEYDDKGNMIHCKNFDGSAVYYEIWFDYDNRGNIIHYKDSYGYEAWLKPILFGLSKIWTNKKPKNWKYEKFIGGLEETSWNH